MSRFAPIRPIVVALLILGIFVLSACATTPPISPAALTLPPVTTAAVVEDTLVEPCPVTQAVWAKPPKDSAIANEPAFGYFYQNQDASIMAGAWWTGIKAEYLRAGEPGIKTGWFRPAGETLEITGERLDGSAPPFHANVPCCYPTRFQATGLYFPTEGCWQITARAAASELSFVVRVAPESE